MVRARADRHAGVVRGARDGGCGLSDGGQGLHGGDGAPGVAIALDDERGRRRTLHHVDADDEARRNARAGQVANLQGVRPRQRRPGGARVGRHRESTLQRRVAGAWARAVQPVDVVREEPGPREGRPRRAAVRRRDEDRRVRAVADREAARGARAAHRHEVRGRGGDELAGPRGACVRGSVDHPATARPAPDGGADSRRRARDVGEPRRTRRIELGVPHRGPRRHGALGGRCTGERRCGEGDSGEQGRRHAQCCQDLSHAPPTQVPTGEITTGTCADR